MRVETLQPTCVYVALSPIHTHSHLMDDWQWAVRSDIQLKSWHCPRSPFTISHYFSCVYILEPLRCIDVYSWTVCPLQWAASAAALTSCASESHISFPPTVAESVCVFLWWKMASWLWTLLLLAHCSSRVSFLEVSSLHRKIPWLWKWAFQPCAWFCINQSERRLQCGAWGWWSDEVGQAFSPCVIVIPVLLRAAVASYLSFLPRFLSHSFIPTSLSHALSLPNLLLFLLLQKETHSIALHCWKGPGLTATSAIFSLLL